MGRTFDLTALDNAACQSCHQQRYQSFADDHPDFGVWPYERRTRIAFNHASHQAKHFAEKKQAFDCRQCHVADAIGRMQLLASYEAACAACHDEKIATSVARGVPMLVLPTLDVAALKAAGHDIGPWPAAATGDFDGRLPPAMKLLLAARSGGGEGDGGAGCAILSLSDVDPKDAKQLAACADLATAIKTLLADVSQRGPVAVRERLSAALGREISDCAGSMRWWPVCRWIRCAGPWRLGCRAWMWVTRRGSDEGTAVGVQRSVAFGTMPDRPTLNPPDATLPAQRGMMRRFRFVIGRRAHADPVLASWLT